MMMFIDNRDKTRRAEPSRRSTHDEFFMFVRSFDSSLLAANKHILHLGAMQIMNWKQVKEAEERKTDPTC